MNRQRKANWPDQVSAWPLAGGVVKLICPSASGARSWPWTSVNPRTAQLYVPLTDWCLTFGPPARPETLMEIHRPGLYARD